jgi:phosphomannomutase
MRKQGVANVATDWNKFRLIVADLDGTLSRSKTPMDQEMAQLILEILKHKAFAVISGGSYTQFQKQFLVSLEGRSKNLTRLYLFPTCATSMYMIKHHQWEKIYGTNLPENDKKQIREAFKKALKEADFEKPKKIYGEQVEDRETQVTFSAFGQLAPFEVKSQWDPKGEKRLHIISFLAKYLPEGYEAKLGGTSSIDITREGIDKAYGIRKIEEKLGFKTDEIFFVGDRMEEGGNDYPVKATGVVCQAVEGPEETKKIFREIIDSSE